VVSARTVVRIGLLTLVAVAVAGCGSQGVPSVDITMGDGQAANGGGQLALSLQILVVLTVLSVAPAILLMATSFTRIVVVLSLLRSAIGIPQLPPNQVLIGLGLLLTAFVMAPTWARVNDEAVQPLMAGTITQDVALERGLAPVRTFMLGQVREEDLATMLDLAGRERPASAQEVPTEVLLPTFVMSELRTAFTMGFLLFVPFLVIDLVVASALMAMGMVMVPPTQIALPFKLLLFILVDGWALVVGALIKSFA
jgi:flagellar biosynthesis protein FliP